MPDRDAYLRELDALLPMPEERRAEIIEEISGHLDDIVAERVERGLPAERAEDQAQARLGAPIDLARDLSRPEQSAWRLLAAAGAGVRSVIGNWIYGYLAGSLAIFVSVFALAAVVQVAGSLLGSDWNLLSSDQGWNSMLVAGAIATGLYYAGRAAVRSVSSASRRMRSEVRPWVAAVLTLASGGIVVFVVEMPHNAASVVAVALAPGAAVLGAYRPTLLPARVRLAYTLMLFIAAVLIVMSLGAAYSVTAGSSEAQPIESLPDRGLSMIGPVRAGDGRSPSIVQNNGWSSDGDVVTWDAEILAPGRLAAFTDLRLEAWHTDAETFEILAGQPGPFATSTVERDGRALHAVIETDRDPAGGFWDLVLTGVGRDGIRYVLEAGSGGNSTFEGTAFDWLVAVLR